MEALAETNKVAPGESVKEAVGKFGGIVDWKTHKIPNEEKCKHTELEKVEEDIMKHKDEAEAAKEVKDNEQNELNNTKRLIDELKLKLKSAQSKEQQAKQDSELAKQKVEVDDGTVETTKEVLVAQARHSTVLAELKSVKDELEKLRVEYSSLVKETNLAVKRSKEAILESTEEEKRVEVLKLELVATKESLDSSNVEHLEAEEERIKAEIELTQDSVNWGKELKKAREELHKLNRRYESVNEVKLKLDQATALLRNLKTELQAYKEGNSKGNQEDKCHSDDVISSPQKELEELRQKIETATTHLNYLKVASASLKSELKREKLAIASTKEREEKAFNTVALLEAELNKTMLDLEAIHVEEVQENENTMLLAHEELSKAKKDIELVKASALMIDRKLYAAQKGTEAARASERLALAAVKTLEGTDGKASKGVTLSLEEYQALSKLSHDVEEQAKLKVEAAVSRIQKAKESELRCLERLDEVNTEKAAEKEKLRIAMEKAEKAELGKRQAGNEHLRRSSEVEPGRRRRSINERQSLVNTATAYVTTSPETVTLSNEMETDSSSETEVLKKKKKKPLFPQIVTFLARKKVQATKVV